MVCEVRILLQMLNQRNKKHIFDNLFDEEKQEDLVHDLLRSGL
ncbi:hypothetical protein [Pseudalkalibacillus hwajinpoensis]